MGEQKRGATTYTIEIEDSPDIISLFKQYIMEEWNLRGTPYTQHHLRGNIVAPLAPRGLILQSQSQVPQPTVSVSAGEGNHKALLENYIRYIATSINLPNTKLGTLAALKAPQEDRSHHIHAAATQGEEAFMGTYEALPESLALPHTLLGTLAAPLAPQDRSLRTESNMPGEDSGAPGAAKPLTKALAAPLAPQGRNYQTAITMLGDCSGAPGAARPHTKTSAEMLGLPNTVQARRGEVNQQTGRALGETENDEGSIFVIPFSLWKYSPPTNALFSHPKQGNERTEEEQRQHTQTKLRTTNEPQRVVEESNARDTLRANTTTKQQYNKNEGE